MIADPDTLLMLQGEITLPSVASKVCLKQKLDWCLNAARTFEYC
jgi:hypothetical protein